MKTSKKGINWKLAFVVALFLNVVVWGYYFSQEQPVCVPHDNIGCNSDCTGYVVDGVRYCTQGSYELYLRTARLVENERQLNELAKN